ncbi:CRISPR-associated protein Cas5 [Bradyrhizobium elkanii]|uniref:CRISPR-associated protein Cas5 n=1 Tax=Bradyrhizobium elkanii TaxID=29448 RepID=A0A4U6RYS2_BRAEL|nr:CRISPR-associated protein Cas5 [Bradyrhizobium sp. BR2003]TKV80394.1 CRISPR-associated protein Cas5 [Bradyrhizobium elkanii]
MDHCVVGKHAKDFFKVASAVSIKPVHRSGHRVTGHIPHLSALRGKLRTFL